MKRFILERMLVIIVFSMLAGLSMGTMVAMAVFEKTTGGVEFWQTSVALVCFIISFGPIAIRFDQMQNALTAYQEYIEEVENRDMGLEETARKWEQLREIRNKKKGGHPIT